MPLFNVPAYSPEEFEEGRARPGSFLKRVLDQPETTEYLPG